MPLSPSDVTGNYRSLCRFPHGMDRTHWHMHLELVYCSGQSVQYELGASEIYLKPDQILLFWAAIPHRVCDSHEDSQVYVINVPAEVVFSWNLPQEFVTLLISGNPLIAEPYPQFRADTFACWHKDLNSDDAKVIGLACGEIHHAVLRLANDFSRKVAQADSRKRKPKIDKTQKLLARVIHHIAEKYSPDLSVGSIANELGYNQKYLTTRFKELAGVTLGSYIRHIKVTRARALLTETDLSIEEIAHTAGFGSMSQLYEQLKRETNMTPKQIRNQHKSQPIQSLPKAPNYSEVP